jgi:hypothetical protein
VQIVAAEAYAARAMRQAGRSHIPFRDSKLTFLLKNSLGGNAKTTLLVAVSARSPPTSASLGTLLVPGRRRARMHSTCGDVRGEGRGVST